MMKKPLKNKDEQLKLTTLAFTLIELLAVIVLLGIIAMLVYPSVNDALTDSKKNAFKLSVTSIYKAVERDKAKLDFTTNSEYIYDNEKLIKVKENGKVLTEAIVIETKGKIIDGKGTIIVDNEGNIIVKLDNQKWCGYNNKNSQNIEIMDGTCEGLTNPDNITPEYCFNFDKNTGTITGYNYDGIECTTDIVIPNIIDDVVVKHIGYIAFGDEVTYQECMDYDYEWHEVNPTYIHYEGDGYKYCAVTLRVDNPLTSVILPKNIETIGYAAFVNHHIEKLDLNNLSQLQIIGDGAFAHNPIEELTLNNLPKLTIIDYAVFYNNQLTELILSNLPQLTTIGDESFYNNQISELTLSNLPKLTIIDEDAFYSNQLTELILSNLPQLTTIGDESFSNNKLTSLTLSNLLNLYIIDGGSFHTNQINDLTLSNLPNLSIISDGAFYNNQINELTLSDLPNLNIIGEWSFEKNQISELTLSNLPQLTIIDEGAFYNNQLTELTLINLPQLTTIGYGSFYVNKITNLTISNLPKLELIDDGAFSENLLTEITLNNLPVLTTIGSDAFEKDSSSNPSLTKIINTNNQSFNWSQITDSSTGGQIFKTGPIIHQNGNIQVVAG